MSKKTIVKVQKLLPSEWARTLKLDERVYTYFDVKDGIITKKQFDKIEV